MERDYAAMMRQIKQETISKAEVARQLNRSRSQIHRLYGRWEKLGDAGLPIKAGQAEKLPTSSREGGIYRVV